MIFASTRSSSLPVAFSRLLPQHAQALDRALDARGDLAGLLVADGLGELRARVGERAQRVPAVDHVLRASRGCE